MVLIEDLGMRSIGHKGKKARYGLYECPVCHKPYECSVNNAKRGTSTKCHSCADKLKVTKDSHSFELEARGIHGDAYSYNLVDYINNQTKVIIGCIACNSTFKQTPNVHLDGHGCPQCAFERNNIALRMSEKNDRPTLLYYIHFPEVNLWKVGCTTKTVEERFRQEKLEYNIIKTKEYTSGSEAYRVEKFILDATKEYKFTGKVLGRGNTELRTQPIDFTKYKEIL